MAKWSFEPGHTAAEFCARHMMVTWVRGHFKDVHGSLSFDPDDPTKSSVEAVIDARNIDSGEPDRDVHLKSADFLDVEHHPHITFRGGEIECLGPNEFFVRGDLTIRGVTKQVPLHVHYLGQWQTPWWSEGVDKGPVTRAGFHATAQIDRRDFGVAWNGDLSRGGVIVSNELLLTLDVEAIREPVPT